MSNNNKLQKLELTWIGKGDEPKLEPRILIENPEYSYGDPNTENMLIHGDNLLALKALEQDYTGKVKCIYIDPPFNTGAAFEHYDDGVEHSIWLDLMHKRFKLLHRLLSNDGVMFVHLDDNEAAYCKILLDEVFGRSNYVNQIINATNKPFGFKSTSKTFFKQANHIFFYAKDREYFSLKPELLFIEKEYDTAYNYVFENTDLQENQWTWRHINEVVANEVGCQNSREAKRKLGDDFEIAVSQFALNNSDRVFQTASVTGGALNKRKETVEYSKQNRDLLVRHENDDMDYIFIGGRRVIYYSERLKQIDGELLPGELLTDMWFDISIEALAKEGNIDFPKGKKPEKLIQRCIELTTDENDIVLDSFLGSGTTAAVAHKLKRRYIGIELGEQAFTHCHTRLKSIIDGSDQTGISRAVNWQGGGGFKFYTLAPPLLTVDTFGNMVISAEYDAQMLAAAMAKQEGFSFQPDENKYWKQGRSSEQDYIFTTTQYLTRTMLDAIAEDLLSEESLLVCCTQFEAGLENAYPNINLRKIPAMLLNRCEFKQDSDYSLNIVDSPLDELRPTTGERIKPNTAKSKDNPKHTTEMPDLFSQTTNE